MRDQAIRNIYPITAVTITDNVVFDEDGSEVIIDELLITPEIERLQAESGITELRIKRNQLLLETDWTANSDVAMSAEMATYRQALRDLPETVDIDNPVYPEKPTGA